MWKKAAARLRSRAGESIAEVLVAVLIAALGIALLAGMIGSSTKVIASSKETAGRYVSAGNALVAQSGEGAGIGTASLTLTDGGNTVASGECTVRYYTNTTLSDAVVSYKVTP